MEINLPQSAFVSVPQDTLDALLDLYAGIVDADRSGMGYSPMTADAMNRLKGKLQQGTNVRSFRVKLNAQA